MWLALNLRDADWGTQAHDASNLLQTLLCNKWEFVSNVLCYSTISVDGKNLCCKERTQFIFILFFIVGDLCGGLDFPLFSNSTLIIWQNLPFQVLQSNSLIISRHSKCRPAKCVELSISLTQIYPFLINLKFWIVLVLIVILEYQLSTSLREWQIGIWMRSCG
jgi:hypothetical protein